MIFFFPIIPHRIFLALGLGFAQIFMFKANINIYLYLFESILHNTSFFLLYIVPLGKNPIGIEFIN